MSTEPAPIEPDTKDWTWVLQRPCPECGFVADQVARDELPQLILANATAWTDILGGANIGQRPASNVWSPLEYACHVKDVLKLYEVRLNLMLAEDDPLYANWDQDETAIAERYGEQDPAQVSAALMVAATSLAERFARLEAPQWQRTGRRSDGASFTIDSFARYFLHDIVHHLHDVNRRSSGS